MTEEKKKHRSGSGFIDVVGGKIASVDWWTPPEVFEKIGLEFDLDVASPDGGVPYLPTKRYFTKEQDGLSQEWEGLVWMNPPYGRETGTWLERFIQHGNGIALVFSRTDTIWFHNTVKGADALVFIKGRLAFRRSGEVINNAATGSLLIGCGETSVRALEKSDMGFFVEIDRSTKEDDFFKL